MRKTNTQYGFTLLEIMIVIVIMGVLASIALSRLQIVVERVKFSEGVHILGILLAAQKRFDIDDGAIDRVYQIGSGASNALQDGDLDVDLPPSNNFDTPAIFDDVDQVAQIRRSSGEFQLSINDQGTIFCGDGGTNWCVKFGCRGLLGECN